MPGTRFNIDKQKWEAFLGQRVLGEFPTKQEAQDCYDKRAVQLFAFPILNKKPQVEEKDE